MERVRQQADGEILLVDNRPAMSLASCRDPLRDSIAVDRLVRDGFQDQQTELALDEIGLLAGIFVWHDVQCRQNVKVTDFRAR